MRAMKIQLREHCANNCASIARCFIIARDERERETFNWRTAPMAEKTFTIQQVASELGVDEATVRRLRQKAQLPARQPGQGYTKAEIAELKKQQRYKRTDESRPAAPPAAGSAAPARGDTSRGKEQRPASAQLRESSAQSSRIARAPASTSDLSAQSSRIAREESDQLGRNVQMRAENDERPGQDQPDPRPIEQDPSLHELMQTIISQN